MRRHVLPRWGKLLASTITRSDIKAMMASIEAPVVANQTLAAVSAIFSWAAKEELVTVNPCRGIDRNATKSRERVLADSEVPRFWSAFDDAGLVAGSALKTILLTGQRPGEVAHMRREHIKDGWWKMPGEPVPRLGWPGTKNGRAIVSGSLPRCKPSWPRWARRHGLRVCRLPWACSVKLDVAMRSICTKLGVERATPHDLRRTFSTTITGLASAATR